MKLYHFILFTLLYSSIESVAQSLDTTQVLKTIRTEYARINSQIHLMDSSSFETIFPEEYDEIDEYGDTVWIDNQSPYELTTTFMDTSGIKLIKRYNSLAYGILGSSTKEFYFKNETLFFYFEESFMDHKLMSQSRIYFNDKRAILYLTKGNDENASEELNPKITRNKKVFIKDPIFLYETINRSQY